MAMLLAEALGLEAFRERVKIYATDVDEEALAQARQAVYTEKQLEPVSAGICGRSISNEPATRFVFRNDLRRSVIFGRHDLIQDAPISRLDLLVCRNTLMYFNAEAQAQHPRALPFRPQRPRLPVPGQSRDAADPQQTSSAPVELKRTSFSPKLIAQICATACWRMAQTRQWR